MQLNIKTEFQELIPPLTKEEFEGLKADLIENGCRDKIILWKEYIIDGDPRFRDRARRKAVDDKKPNWKKKFNCYSTC